MKKTSKLQVILALVVTLCFALVSLVVAHPIKEVKPQTAYKITKTDKNKEASQLFAAKKKEKKTKKPKKAKKKEKK